MYKEQKLFSPQQCLYELHFKSFYNGNDSDAPEMAPAAAGDSLFFLVFCVFEVNY